MATMSNRITDIFWNDELYVAIRGSVVQKWSQEEWIKLPISAEKISISASAKKILYISDQRLYLSSLKTLRENTKNEDILGLKSKTSAVLWGKNDEIMVAGDKNYIYNKTTAKKLQIILHKEPSYLHDDGWGIEGDIKIHVLQSEKWTNLENPKSDPYPFLLNRKDTK